MEMCIRMFMDLRQNDDFGTIQFSGLALVRPAYSEGLKAELSYYFNRIYYV